MAQFGWTRTGAGVLVAAATMSAGIWAWLLIHLSQTGAELAAAALLERLAPELGTAPTSAVDLARRLEQQESDFSRDLAEAHIERTAESIQALDLTQRVGQQRQRPRRWAAAALAAAGLWTLLLTALLPLGRSRLTTLLLDPTAIRHSDVPLAGDLRITYRFPAYTGLPPRIVQGGDGSVSAVAGTEVEINATADLSVQKATIRIEDRADGERTDGRTVPMQVTDGRKLAARFSVLRDGRYRFALVDEDGDAIEERHGHPIRALPDGYPDIRLDEPSKNLELRDNQDVKVRWRAEDDFGVSEVHLVAEPIEAPGKAGRGSPKRIPMARSDGVKTRREGRYRWSVADLGIDAGGAVRFHLEAVDNDTISGPKRAVSASLVVTLFSARRHHKELVAKQQSVVDGLVDWLAAEITSPFPNRRDASAGAALQTQGRLLQQMQKLEALLATLVQELRLDKLSRPGIATAFGNILEHVEQMRTRRQRLVMRAGSAGSSPSIFSQTRASQKRDIVQLEKDVIYLDDLLALQRIDELKQTAKDLLASQRELQDLLQRYRETQDPALRAELQQRIGDLKDRMLELLAKMAQIKRSLPGEYRNLEAASQLKIDDQLKRLEQSLREGDLDTAARELEQLANMIENMVDQINNAEEKFGGERYSEMRKQLSEFANEFRQLESEQKALSQRADEMLKNYRQKAIKEAGKSLQHLIEQARKETGKALKALDGAADIGDLWSGLGQAVHSSRQNLLDLDSLLTQRDLAEAQKTARRALEGERRLQTAVRGHARLLPKDKAAKAREAAKKALEHTGKVADMLDRLFPKPEEVLTPKQMNQMRGMGGKQGQLRQQAQGLGQRMQQMAGELPLFGGEPRVSLDNAMREMQGAQNDVRRGELPGAAQHKRRAVQELGKLRQALEQASQQSQGGMPLPLGMGGGQGGRQGGRGDMSHEEVEIPDSAQGRKNPRFREQLMEAAKQKPPLHFEEAVRRYYEELIR